MTIIFFIVSGLFLLLTMQMHFILQDEGMDSSWFSPFIRFWELSEIVTEPKRRLKLKLIFWTALTLVPLELLTLIFVLQ